MSGLWEAQLVVAACALPQPMVAALLRTGAKAVVCRWIPGNDPASSPEPSPEAAVAFFEVRALIGEMLTQPFHLMSRPCHTTLRGRQALPGTCMPCYEAGAAAAIPTGAFCICHVAISVI